MNDKKKILEEKKGTQRSTPALHKPMHLYI